MFCFISDVVFVNVFDVGFDGWLQFDSLLIFIFFNYFMVKIKVFKVLKVKVGIVVVKVVFGGIQFRGLRDQGQKCLFEWEICY